MHRQFWLKLHRYAGLGMAVFLVIVGLTGSLLAFGQEIDDWLNPDRDRVAVRVAPMLEPLQLRDRAVALVPWGRNAYVDLHARPDRSFEIIFAPPPDPVTGAERESGYVALKLDPYTGAELSRRDPSQDKHESWPLTRENVMDTIRMLHIQLLMGQTGNLILGIVALVWLLDCFVSVYLTLPARISTAQPVAAPPDARRRSRLPRWAIAWKIRWRASTFRLNFDLHRAGGLWLWGMLFMFAWSSGTFNLQPVFRPVNDFFFEPPPTEPAPLHHGVESTPDFRAALPIARQLMAEQARLHDFKITQEYYIAFASDRQEYIYAVNGDRLFGQQDGTYIRFDAARKTVTKLYMPSGQYAGITLINWLSALHMAAFGGIPYKTVVLLMGLAITMLSGTGVYIWWRKRRARLAGARLTPARGRR
ncbi:MAG: PepSY domain-containing protein [Proteobacteria bacterium]|nr:PepSY domain-containing protein [Pseudomonadota bacterium]